MARLWVFRHAPASVTGVCYGQSDVPTTLSHEEAAEIIAARLPAGATLEAIWTSPLARCREPAAILSARLSAPLRVDARLLELSFGDWEGRTYATLEADPGFRWWSEHWMNAAPPNGESLDTLLRRVRLWLDDGPQASRPPREKADLQAVVRDSGSHLVVAHAGVVRALRMLLEGVTAENAWRMAVPHLELAHWTTGSNSQAQEGVQTLSTVPLPAPE